MRLEDAIVAEFDAIANYGESRDANILSDARGRGNNRARIDLTHCAHQPRLRWALPSPLLQVPGPPACTAGRLRPRRRRSPWLRLAACNSRRPSTSAP